MLNTNELEQVLLILLVGKIYPDYDMEIAIPNTKKIFFIHIQMNYGVKGLTIGLDEDDGSERTMKLYLLETVDSTAIPVPVLVNGCINTIMLPQVNLIVLDILKILLFQHMKDLNLKIMKVM